MARTARRATRDTVARRHTKTLGRLSVTRRGLVRSSCPPVLVYNTNRDALSLLVALAHDTQIGQPQLRRLMMCAGASPHVLFDAEGHPCTTAKSMLTQLLTRGYTPEYIPQCPRAVETWLKTASVNVASVRAACQGTGHGVKYATDEVTRPPTPTDAPAEEANSESSEEDSDS